VHDSLREMLVDALGLAENVMLHQSIAELLDEGHRSSFEMLCASALHYAAGEIDKTPKRRTGPPAPPPMQRSIVSTARR
jgi:hypothetical protein